MKIDAALDRGRDRMLQSLGGKLLSEKPLTMSYHRVASVTLGSRWVTGADEMGG